MDARIEHTFHDQMWGLANDSMRIERAVSDGRDLAYQVLRRSDDDALRYVANYWLDTNGRDSRRDEQLRDRQETPTVDPTTGGTA